MFWGQKAIDQWTSMVQKTLPNSEPTTTAVLGMNELVSPRLLVMFASLIVQKFFIDQNKMVNQI
jgi:hypothetical protein